jgi:hypothetical protein
VSRNPSGYECRILFFTDGKAPIPTTELEQLMRTNVRRDVVGFGSAVSQEVLNQPVTCGGTVTIGETMEEVQKVFWIIPATDYLNPGDAQKGKIWHRSSPGFLETRSSFAQSSGNHHVAGFPRRFATHSRQRPSFPTRTPIPTILDEPKASAEQTRRSDPCDLRTADGGKSSIDSHNSSKLRLPRGNWTSCCPNVNHPTFYLIRQAKHFI